MRFLILAHIDDETALRVYAALGRQHGADAVRLVSGEELIFAPHWSFRSDNTSVTTEIQLGDGTVLTGDNLGIVLNRLRYIVQPHFEWSHEADSNYALMETHALWLSWLASLPCPVINRISPRGLGAQERSHSEWLYLAGKAGLPTQGFSFTSDPRLFHESGYVSHRRRSGLAADSSLSFEQVSTLHVSRQPTFYLEKSSDRRQKVLVVGDEVIGGLADRYRGPLQQLAILADCDLLQVVFCFSPGIDTDLENWQVCSVTSFPLAEDYEAISLIVTFLEEKLKQIGIES